MWISVTFCCCNAAFQYSTAHAIFSRWDRVFRIALTKINYFFFLLGSQVWMRKSTREEFETRENLMTGPWYGGGQASYLLMRVYGYINGDAATQFLEVFELVKFSVDFGWKPPSRLPQRHLPLCSPKITITYIPFVKRERMETKFGLCNNHDDSLEYLWTWMLRCKIYDVDKGLIYPIVCRLSHATMFMQANLPALQTKGY
ncbi:hypothetical protein RclHR1_00820002 [Rhizophagus clarus]|uniref:Uncharacterized protein n=1 Tax=Rhizophagus clarus TaxID=94130 RepID=A0A2Z6SB97_9GLOM|nr:hypothetical protein RclHR1_00820002 [Rhizophagus clarus]